MRVISFKIWSHPPIHIWYSIFWELFLTYLPISDFFPILCLFYVSNLQLNLLKRIFERIWKRLIALPEIKTLLRTLLNPLSVDEKQWDLNWQRTLLWCLRSSLTMCRIGSSNILGSQQALQQLHSASYLKMCSDLKSWF